MHQDTSTIADLLGSRICHDLISPLGAISNGLELLSMNAGLQGPELELVSQSVEHANIRIRLFRIAFGSAAPGQHVARSELDAILSGLSASGRLVIDWQAPADVDRQVVKLVFLLILAIETAMPRGGHIRVNELGGEWSVLGSSDRLSIDPDLWQHLASVPGNTSLEPARVQFALAPATAAAIGRKLTVDSSDGSVRIRF